MRRDGDITRRQGARVAAITAGGVLSCLVVTTAFVAWVFKDADAANFARAMWCAVVLPIVLATPWFAFLSLKTIRMSVLNTTLHHAATHDEMTGLFNWSAFHQRLDAADRAGSRSGHTLLLIDLDHFKSVNDRFGHQVGDTVLRAVATTLQRVAGPSGVVGRLGGEEFGVLMSGCDAVKAAMAAEALRAAVASARPDSDGGPIILSVSVGGVVFTKPTTGAEAMLHADRLLYRAKAAGRDRVVLEAAGVVAAVPAVAAVAS